MTEPYRTNSFAVRTLYANSGHDDVQEIYEYRAAAFDSWLARLKADTLAPVFALHKPLKVWESDRVYTIVCAECKLKAYPCPTVLAITEEDHEME